MPAPTDKTGPSPAAASSRETTRISAQSCRGAMAAGALLQYNDAVVAWSGPLLRSGRIQCLSPESMKERRWFVLTLERRMIAERHRAFMSRFGHADHPLSFSFLSSSLSRQRPGLMPPHHRATRRLDA